MPFCHRHPGVQVITDYLGVPHCRACEIEQRAAVRRQCTRCAAPVDTPGLCHACARVDRRRRGLSWVADHQYWIMLALAALVACGVYVAINLYLVPAFKQIDESPAYKIRWGR